MLLMQILFFYHLFGKKQISREKLEKCLVDKNSVTMQAGDVCQRGNMEFQKVFICCKRFLGGYAP
jgi:hypothetical protein